MDENVLVPVADLLAAQRTLAEAVAIIEALSAGDACTATMLRAALVLTGRVADRLAGAVAGT